MGAGCFCFSFLIEARGDLLSESSDLRRYSVPPRVIVGLNVRAGGIAAGGSTAAGFTPVLTGIAPSDASLVFVVVFFIS